MGKYDEAWKEVIENLFEQFMYFYMPDVAEDIDFNKGFTFLDKEFQTIAGKSEDTSRELDKLVRVYLKNDEETWILVHIDVQEESKEEFAGRMFRYFYDPRGKPTFFRRGIVDVAGENKVILRNLEKDVKEMLYSGRR